LQPTPEQEIRRAERARQLLEDPLTAEALDAIESNVLSWWEESNVKDVEFRERCWAIYSSARKFRKLMQSHMETGKLAREQINPEKRFLGVF
jgi:hypothetical protein